LKSDIILLIGNLDDTPNLNPSPITSPVLEFFRRCAAVWPTDILDSALAKKKQEREQLRKQLLAAAMQTLDKLAREIPFEQAYIFGSVSKPHGFNELSDLDVAFKGLKDEDFFKAMSFISSEVGRDNVDVVQLEGHRLAEKIIREGIPWKRKD